MPLVGFELRLARASCADAAAKSAHRLVPDGKPRQIVLVLRKLDLEFSLAGLGSLRENIENQRAPVQNRRACNALKRLDLRRREIVVKNHKLRARFLDQIADLLCLALTDEAVRIRRWARLQDRSDALAARRLQKCLQFLERRFARCFFSCKAGGVQSR